MVLSHQRMVKGMIGYLPLEEDIRLGGYEISSAVNYGWPESISQKSLTNFKEQLLSEIKAEIGQI